MHVERILKALANRRRLAILAYLDKHREATVTDLGAYVKLSIKATSKHLNLLYHAELLDRRQIGLSVYYSLAKPLHPLARVSLNHL